MDARTHWEQVMRLEAGGKIYRAVRLAPPAGVQAAALGSSTDGYTRSRVAFMQFPALPAGVKSVSVRSAATAQAVDITVDRPVTSAEDLVPNRGQVVLEQTGNKNSVPALVTIHGVRRVPGATALYYSVGALREKDSIARELGSYRGLMFVGGGPIGHFTDSFGLIDRVSNTFTGQLRYGSIADRMGTLERELEAALQTDGQLHAAYSLLPPLPARVARVDVVIAGQRLVTGVPVEDGPLVPASAEAAPIVGRGWPSIVHSAGELSPADSAAATIETFDTISDGDLPEAGKKLELNSDVLFDYNKASLTPKATEVIAKAAKKITDAKVTGTVLVTGHTDSDGSDAYNVELSKKRAQAVASALKGKIPASVTLKVEGKGEKEPIASNDNDTGKQMNRRVTLTLPK